MKFSENFLGTYWRFISLYASEADRKAVLKIFDNLVRSRTFERKIISLAREGRIKKRWIFGGIGQEGGQAAVVSLLSVDDWLIPSLRSYTSLIAKGFPLKLIAAEIFGKKRGGLRGLGPPFTVHSPEYGLAQRSDVVGIDCSTAVGIALGLRRKKQPGIVVNFFGDGAATRGPVWSSLNLSALWKLPVFWICENNQYSVTTHISSLTAEPFFKKAAAFGVYSKKVNGNDPLAVYFLAKKMLDFIRRERKPAFLELTTYRLMGHDLFFLKDQSYQDPEEMEKWLEQDPLKILEDHLLTMQILNLNQIKETRNSAVAEVEEAVSWAEKQKDVTKKEFLTTSFL